MLTRVWLASIVFTTVGTLALCCLPWLSPSVRIRSIGGVERRTHLRFPEGTTLIESRLATNYFAGVLAATVRMPHAALKTFISGQPFVGRLSASERELRDDERAAKWLGMEQWHPDDAKSYLSGSAIYDHDSHVVIMLADCDHPEAATMYLMWGAM